MERTAKSLIIFKRSLILCFISIISFPMFLVAEGGAPAKIQIPSGVFDFGSVAQGSKVKHEFLIRNSGGSDLIIQQIVPACGCTASSASSNIIKPGSDGTIRVEFDTSGFIGEKEKTVRINTSDPETPSSVLTLRGYIEPDVVIEPSRITFGEVARDATASPPEETVTVSVKEGTELSLGEIQTLSAWLEVKELQSTPKQKKLSVSLRSGAPIGELRERVVIAVSGSGSRKSVNIPVLASIKGALQLRPSTVSFGVIEGSKPLERSVSLENRSKNPLIIQGVKTDNPAVKTELKTIQDGKIYVIKVLLDPTQVTKDLRALVQIETNSQTEPKLSLNVYGVLPPTVN